MIPTGWTEISGDIDEQARLAHQNYQEEVPGIEPESPILLLVLL